MATEVKNASGFDFHRSLDAVLMNTYPSSGLVFHGIEIKVDKADLMNEIRQPEKHEAFYPYLDFFSIACPSEIIDLDQIPKFWGVLCPDKTGRIRWKRKALPLHEATSKTVDRAFTVAFLRSICLRGDDKAELVDLLNQKFEEGKQRGLQEAKLAYNDRKAKDAIETIERFKELTGVDLCKWNVEKEAALFKTIHEAEPGYLEYTLQNTMKRLAESSHSIQKSLDILSEFKTMSNEKD